MLPETVVAGLTAVFFVLLFIKDRYEVARFNGELDPIPHTLLSRLGVLSFYLLFIEMGGYLFLFSWGATGLLYGPYLQIWCPAGLLLQLTGATLTFMGLGLAFWSVWQIEGKKLATTGPYHYVRHPIYFACNIIATGLFLLYLNPVALIPLLIIPGQMRAAREEEKILARRHGQRYIEYQRRTRPFLPGRRRG